MGRAQVVRGGRAEVAVSAEGDDALRLGDVDRPRNVIDGVGSLFRATGNWCALFKILGHVTLSVEAATRRRSVCCGLSSHGERTTHRLAAAGEVVRPFFQRDQRLVGTGSTPRFDSDSFNAMMRAVTPSMFANRRSDLCR